MILAEANQLPVDVRPISARATRAIVAVPLSPHARLFMALRLEDRQPIWTSWPTRRKFRQLPVDCFCVTTTS